MRKIITLGLLVSLALTLGACSARNGQQADIAPTSEERPNANIDRNKLQTLWLEYSESDLGELSKSAEGLAYMQAAGKCTNLLFSDTCTQDEIDALVVEIENTRDAYFSGRETGYLEWVGTHTTDEKHIRDDLPIFGEDDQLPSYQNLIADSEEYLYRIFYFELEVRSIGGGVSGLDYVAACLYGSNGKEHVVLIIPNEKYRASLYPGGEIIAKAYYVGPGEKGVPTFKVMKYGAK